MSILQAMLHASRKVRMKPENKWDFESVRAVVRSAIRKLLKEPKLLDFQINERTLTQRLSMRLQPAFHPLFVDCEYNRMWTEQGDRVKRLRWRAELTRTDDINGNTVYPDIVVHKRGTQAENRLVIEAKRRGSTLAKGHKDYRKLCAFTNPKGLFHYNLGAHLYFRRNGHGRARCHIVWFARGDVTGVTDDVDNVTASFRNPCAPALRKM